MLGDTRLVRHMVRRDNVVGVVVGFGMVVYVLFCGSVVAVAAELARGDEFNGVQTAPACFAESASSSRFAAISWYVGSSS